MATKKPAPRAATLDDLIASGYRYGGSLDPLPQAPAAEPTTESRGAVRGAADLGLSFGRGAVQGVRMFTDLAGADNAVSSGLRSVEDFIGGLRSAQAKQDDQAIAAILKEAEGKGVLDQVVAGFRAFAQAPGSTMAQALGTSVPTIAAALATGGAAPGAALAARAVPAAVGALQGTGAVKGSIYDEVYRRALTEGRTEEEARALAEQAQAYSGDNAGQLALGAGLGALAGGSGLERGVQALRGGVTTAAPGIARRVGMGALAEGIPEALQGGQEKYATNVAQDRAGFPTDPMAGVVASGTMEAIAGNAMGGAFGIPRPPVARPGDELRKDKLPENGPMTRALNQGVEAAAQAADKGAPIPPELTDAPGATPPPQGMEFEADPRFANAPTFGNGQAPASQRFGTKLAADLFIGEQGLMGSHQAIPVEGGFEVRPTAAPSVSMVAPGVYETPSAPAAQPAPRVTRLTPAAQSTGAPAQADEGTAPQAPVAPVLQPEVAPEETSLAPGASEPPGPVQPGDVTMKNGKPFTVKNNGLLRAFERRLGPGYVRTPVEGGIVLRKVGGDGPVAGDAQPGAADDGGGQPASAAGVVGRGGQVRPAGDGGESDPALSGNGFIAAPNGYKVRISRHVRGSNALDPTADVGAFIYEMRKGDNDLNPLTMVVSKDGKLVAATSVLTNNESNGTAWVPKSEASANTVARLLVERAKTAAGSPERKAVDAKIAEAVAADQAGPTGGAAAPDPALRIKALSAQWADAVARGDAAEARRINDLIVEARKPPAAPAPQPEPEAAPAAQPLAEAPGREVIPEGLSVTFGGRTFKVESLNDAQAKWIEFRDRTGAGVSSIGNGVRVTDGAGRFVARISYNGRVWDSEDDGKNFGNVLAEAPDGNPDPDAERERGARERPAAQWAEQQAERLGLESISAGIGRAVGGLGDVIVDIKSAPGVLPVVAEVRAEYQGKRLESRGVEGDAAIKAAVDEYAGKIQQARERMAARVQADERGLPAGDLRTELQQVEQQILAAAPGRFAKGGGDIEAAAKRKEVPAALKERRKALKAQIRAADAAPKPEPAPAPAPEPAPPPAAEPAPAPEPPARTPEQARTIELKKRLKVLEALRRCVG